jgi:hypothetical protein
MYILIYEIIIYIISIFQLYFNQLFYFILTLLFMHKLMTFLFVNYLQIVKK